MATTTDDQSPAWLTVREAAHFSRSSISTVRRAIRRRRLRAYRLSGGSALRLHQADVNDWLRAFPAELDRG